VRGNPCIYGEESCPHRSHSALIIRRSLRLNRQCLRPLQASALGFWWWMFGFSFFWEASELFNFAMESMASKMGVILLFFHSFGLELLVAGAHVPRDRFVFGLGFGAFEDDNISGHDVCSYLVVFVSVSAAPAKAVLFDPAPSMVPRLPNLFRWRTTPSFSS